MSRNDPLFEKLTLLERLEEIREELDELGISSFDELRQRIDQLEAEIGDADDDQTAINGSV